MTVTPTAQGAHARLANDLAGRRRPRRWRPLAAAMLALALVTGAGASAIAAERADDPATVDASAERASSPRVTLAPLASGVVTPETSLVAPVIVENLTDQPLAPATARLEIGHGAITDRAVLDAWLAGTLDPASLGAFVAGGEAPIEPVLPGELATATITVEGAAPEIAGLAPGVYPILVRYTPDAASSGAVGGADTSTDQQGDTEPLLSTSTMLVRDPAAAPQPFEVGLIVPITAPALASGLLSAAELRALTAPGGALSASLEAVAGTPAILAIDPAILAAIRVLGTDAPGEAVDWLARLDALPNERFSLAFADGDLATAFAAGLPTPFTPSTLQAYMRPEDFIPIPSPSPSAETPSPGSVSSSGLPISEYAKSGMFTDLTEDPTPGDAPSTTPSERPSDAPEPNETPAYPTLETLLDVPGARHGVVWPVTGTASGALLAHLGAAATAEGHTGVGVLASANTAQGIETRTVPARGMAGDSSVLVYDASISAALRNAASAQSTLLRGAPLTAAAAQLTLASAEIDGQLLVSVDRGMERTKNDLSAAINAVFEMPGATPRTLGELLAAEPTQIDIVEAPAAQERVDVAHRLVETEGRIGAFATVLDDPGLLTTPERASIAQLLGAGWFSAQWPSGRFPGTGPASGQPQVGQTEQQVSETPEAAWNRAIVDHEARSARTLSSVGILPPSTTNLLSADAKLQFWVRNDLPYPVNVVFITSPNDLRLEVTRSTPVTALPSSNTRVEVPVIAKVGSGDVQLQLELRSPTLQPIGAPVTAEVAVRADWELIGIISLAAIVGTLFVVGIIRTVLARRGRRNARSAPASRDADEPDHADADEAHAPDSPPAERASSGPAPAEAAAPASSAPARPTPDTQEPGDDHG